MIEFQVAAPGQAGDVLSVLNEAADWLRARGISQWPERFDPSWVDDAIRRGETWLVRADSTLRVPRGFANPGSFDIAGHLARRGIRVVGSVWDSTRVERIPRRTRGVAMRLSVGNDRRPHRAGRAGERAP